MRPLPLLGLLLPLFHLSAALYTAVPRWAQAVAIINDALFVYGGKTDQYNAYGYDSAPWNNDLLFLSLSSPFDPSNPPWQYVSGSQNTSISSQGPTLAWHSLSAFNSSFCLIFGGNTGPQSGIVLLDNDDSSELLNVVDRTSPTFLTLAAHWAGEPQRRMRHATASINGSIYIIGGEAADGSGNTFSTHFVFIPSVPTFAQLPSENAPPGIFGHTAVILLDGRLLVFGGISQGQLVPLSTIWILDTTKFPLTWVLASVDDSNLPNPRSSFAVVLLDDGRVLIHGGTDATFQPTFADGWVLDPSTSPMTWASVPALSQVGPRKDHFGINAGGQVVFGFGYGNNAPASAPLQIYNVDSSTYQPTFTPMTAPPARTTLPPDPSQTLTNPPGSSPTTGNPSGSSDPSQTRPSGSRSNSQSGAQPSGTGPGRGGNGGSEALGRSASDKVAIILGTVLGTVGAAGIVALAVWYMRRRQARLGPAFNPLDDDDEDPHSVTAIRMGATRDGGPRILAMPLWILSMTGLARSRRYMNRSRRDILADEDRSFDWVDVSREGSGGRSSYGGRSTRSSVRGLSHAITERFASIRNLTRGSGSAPHSRVPSTTIDWEKMGGDPFSPEVALMAEGLARDELPERSQVEFALSGPSQPYTDPFTDHIAAVRAQHDYDSEPEPDPPHSPEPERKDRLPKGARPPALRTALPHSTDFVPLSPLVEQVSQNSLSNSSTSHHTNSDQNAGSGSSARSPRPSSILDPNPPPSEPIRRSNSWWARFTKTPLLERRGTESSTRPPSGFIDFRDPNPMPRLVTIEESGHSQRSSDALPELTQSQRRTPSLGLAANRARAGTPTRRPTLYRETVHGRSASSLQTANTETLERLGGTMDIIQREGTLESQHTPLTGAYSLEDDFGVTSGDGVGAGSTHQSRTLFLRGGELTFHSSRTDSSSYSVDSPMILSPPASGAVTPNTEFPETASPPSVYTDEVHVEGEDRSPHSPGVADRVRAFERRMSREAAPAPLPTNTRRREERTSPVTTRPAVRYGLVPRPSLFVANPDGTRGSEA